MTTKRRVVITGMGVATPIGIGIQPFWDALMEGRCGINRVKSFDPSGFASQVGGELPEFQLADAIPKSYRKSAKVMSRDITIAVLCAYHAVVDAGLRTKCLIDRGEAQAPPNVDSTRFGANIGAGLVCADLYELAAALSTAADEKSEFSLTKWGSEGMSNLTPLWLLKFLPNMLACHVTIVHDAQAPSNTITCGEASSHLAIGEAFRIIARGDADVCICGGAESKMNPMAMARPHLLGRLNVSDNDQPKRASRPFAATRLGMVAAEGGGLVILESLDHARDRGARIYAEVVGFGAGAGSYSESTPDNHKKSVEISIRKALSDASMSANIVDFAVPQGLGTIPHDASEMSGWNAAIGERLTKIPAFTPRGSVGNCGAGAGAIDFAAMVMALHRNTIPPSLNTDQIDPICKFGFVQRDPKDRPVNVAVSTATAMSGGQSAAIVVRKFSE